MCAIRVESLNLNFRDEKVLEDVSCEIEEGEFCVVLGPSGSGKTMFLKSIAGLVSPDSGTISLRDTNVDEVQTTDRDLGYVFQEFEETLFPHKTVEENIQFGLEQQSEELSPAEIETRIDDILDLLAITDTKQDYPTELSGGQQQRVEIARQVVRRCDLMLLDDPLADLDYKLEKRMEIEMRNIHRDLGNTFIYVTHNQDQGLKLADRIIVLNDGQIEQIGTPSEVYYDPQNAFVALFIGDNNAFRGEVVKGNGNTVVVETAIGSVDVSTTDDLTVGTSGILTIRPENVVIEGEDGSNTVTAEVQAVTFMGDETELILQPRDTDRSLLITKPGQTQYELGDSVPVSLDKDEVQFFTTLSRTEATSAEELLSI